MIWLLGSCGEIESFLVLNMRLFSLHCGHCVFRCCFLTRETSSSASSPSHPWCCCCWWTCSTTRAWPWGPSPGSAWQRTSSPSAWAAPPSCWEPRRPPSDSWASPSDWASSPWCRQEQVQEPASPETAWILLILWTSEIIFKSVGLYLYLQHFFIRCHLKVSRLHPVSLTPVTSFLHFTQLKFLTTPPTLHSWTIWSQLIDYWRLSLINIIVKLVQFTQVSHTLTYIAFDFIFWFCYNITILINNLCSSFTGREHLFWPLHVVTSVLSDIQNSTERSSAWLSAGTVVIMETRMMRDTQICDFMNNSTINTVYKCLLTQF